MKPHFMQGRVYRWLDSTIDCQTAGLTTQFTAAEIPLLQYVKKQRWNCQRRHKT
jgi:hypothetical protein